MGEKNYLCSVIMIKFSQGLGTLMFAGAYTPLRTNVSNVGRCYAPTCFIIYNKSPSFIMYGCLAVSDINCIFVVLVRWCNW